MKRESRRTVIDVLGVILPRLITVPKVSALIVLIWLSLTGELDPATLEARLASLSTALRQFGGL